MYQDGIGLGAESTFSLSLLFRKLANRESQSRKDQFSSREEERDLALSSKALVSGVIVEEREAFWGKKQESMFGKLADTLLKWTYFTPFCFSL